MREALHAGQTETAQVQKTAIQKSSRAKQPLQRAVASTRLPSYTQTWGNQPPPWLRLSGAERPPHEEEYVAPIQKKENKTGLPDTLKSGIENLSGFSMDDVHVHYNSPKTAEVGALAYTQGTEIHVGPGQEQHVAHEAWHVVQQKQGRVKPTMQTKRAVINDNPRLEHEATIMGEKVTRGESVQHGVRPPALHTIAANPMTPAHAPIQCNGGGSQSEQSGEGRKKAAEIAKASPPDSVGYGISLLLSPVTALFGDIGGAKIGTEVYEKNKDILHKPGTEENVSQFTTIETEYFRQQSGLAKHLGSIWTAETRTKLVMDALEQDKKQRENLKKSGHPFGESRAYQFGSALAGLD